MDKNTKQRGAVPKRSSVPVTVPIPKTWNPSIKDAVMQLDTDRSKFVRAAVKEKLERMGIRVPNLAA